MQICKNCNHPIVKRTWESNGQVFRGWKHKNGGTYCKARDRIGLGACLCSTAEPKEDNSSIPRKDKSLAYP
jgi:hypothetical protein